MVYDPLGAASDSLAGIGGQPPEAPALPEENVAVDQSGLRERVIALGPDAVADLFLDIAGDLMTTAEAEQLVAEAEANVVPLEEEIPVELADMEGFPG